MNPSYPDYELTYADFGIDSNNPNEGYYSSDDGEFDPAGSATGSDYAAQWGSLTFIMQRDFPDWDHLPWENSLNTWFWTDNHGCYAPSDHPWAFVGEIVENRSLFRPGFLIRDREGKKVLIEYYLDNQAQLTFKDYRIGRTVLYYAEKRQFVDGQVGIRIEEMTRSKVIPCTLETLMTTDPEGVATSPSCARCNGTSTSLSACSAC